MNKLRLSMKTSKRNLQCKWKVSLEPCLWFLFVTRTNRLCVRRKDKQRAKTNFLYKYEEEMKWHLTACVIATMQDRVKLECLCGNVAFDNPISLSTRPQITHRLCDCGFCQRSTEGKLPKCVCVYKWKCRPTNRSLFDSFEIISRTIFRHLASKCRFGVNWPKWSKCSGRCDWRSSRKWWQDLKVLTKSIWI